MERHTCNKMSFLSSTQVDAIFRPFNCERKIQVVHTCAVEFLLSMEHFVGRTMDHFMLCLAAY